MPARIRRLDAASAIVIVITLILFAIACIEKGLTHDLLLEAGIFLVSVKLILMSARANVADEQILARLTTIEAALARRERDAAP